MSVHYKFKAALDFSTVTFDGIHISVSELKKSIIDQKRLGKNADFDLQIINAQTKEVYSDENALIPKNTSVIVARVPITDRKKSGPAPLSKENAPGGGRGMHKGGGFHQQSGAEVAKGSDLSSMDLTEEEKIKAMMNQSTADYDPSHYIRIRGANQHGRVPDNYRCNRCNQGGHWIRNCPNVPAVTPDVKKSTGIPRSFMVVVDSPDFPGALMTPEGRYAVPAVDHAAYLEKNKGQQSTEQPAKPKIPDDLVCPLCNDLLTDALLVPCCANSYCDDCIRSFLLESDHECPGCHEKDISPTSLIPNRFLRGTVNAFKSDTGYSKPEKIPERPAKSPPKESPIVEEPRKLSLDELPDDLFPHSPKKIDSETEGAQATDAESTKDLYDFNDSIPSPFASPKRTETKADVPIEQQAIQSLGRSFHGSSQPGMMRGTGGPPPSHHPPHQKPPPSSAMSGAVEPPPPGFDVPPGPPGEDNGHNRPPLGNNRGPPKPVMDRERGNVHDNQQRDGRDGGPPPNRGPGPPLPHQQQQQQQTLLPLPPNVPPPSFNPMQPPPGYPGPPSHGPPPGAPGGPPGIPPHGFGPGPGPPHGPNQNMPPFQNNFSNRLPPPMNRGPPPMHHGGPPLRHHMDHHDDYRHGGRGRRPYGPRMDEPHREDESRVGIIEDPLKEFERIMREKDRRKKMAAAGPRKRSKSRSFSPPPRRTSPYPPKRSRSRSPFSRSPSPKRKRPPPGPKRRRSYSRSPSRSPPPIRRGGKSRSRSRNRSVSPTPPGKLRRSPPPPRRAPPYSPSPPPSRFSRKDKDDYFDNRGRDSRDSRYDDRGPPRFPNKPYESSRDYDRKYDNPLPPKHDIQSSHKYEPRPPNRSYHGHVGHGVTHEPPPSYRDKPSVDTKRPYDYEPNIVPPGTENIISTVPSLMDLNMQPLQNNPNVYPISTIGGGNLLETSREPSEVDKSRRAAATAPEPDQTISERKKSEEEHGKDHEDDKNSDRRKKSPPGKKHKKEKKKHKKRSRDEKKGKKTKKTKDDKTTEGDKSSDDEAETENIFEAPNLSPGEELTKTLQVAGNVIESSADSIAKQTAPCDSTVKSPDRVHEADASVKEENMTVVKTDQVSEPMKRRDSIISNVSQVIGHEVPDDPKTSDYKSIVSAPELHLPPSKWDEYEDYITGGEAPKPQIADPNIPIVTELKRDPSEKVVTSEVLKRAEHAIFDKPSKAMPDPLDVAVRRPVTPPAEGKELASQETRKPYREGLDVPLQANIVQQIKPDLKTSSVVSAVYRKSAKDRLGSKLSEDEVILNANKPMEAVSIRSKVSAVREEAGRKRRSRSRSPAFASSRYRNRSRSKSIDRHRNRSKNSAERQRPPPEKDSRRSPMRKVSPLRQPRDRRRSASREKRRSGSRDKRPDSKNRPDSRDRRRSPSPRERKRSASRERKRSPSRERKMSPSRERRRSRSRERERERRRSGSRGKRRSRSREKKRSRSRERRRSRSQERRRTPSRERRRSPSRDRDHYRPRHRSPYRRTDPSRTKEDSRDDGNRGREPFEKIRLNLLEERKEPIPPRSTDNSSTALKLEEPPSPEARVFQQSGSSHGRSDQVFSPTLKKQKGRINIKLSSIAKTDHQQSGSSSSDDDHEQQTVESKHSESGEDGKRRKKRRHSSTSTKSSSSSDTKRKKRKKEKKKKKKKKRSK